MRIPVVVALSLSVVASVVMAKDSQVIKNIERYFNSKMSEITKTDAMRELLVSADAQVYKCYQVQLSDKLTIVRKK